MLAALGQVGDEPIPTGQATTLPLQMEGRLRSPEELEQLVVGKGPDGGVVLLRDIGRVSLGSENYGSVARNLKGDPTVALGVFQRDGSNALTVSEAVERALADLEPRFPPGVELQLIVNEADTVRQSIGEAAGSLRDAVLLVFLALLLGLGNSRLALISALAVPVSLLGSITLINLSGTSINTLSLFGMVLASGLVVDDAIVVSEDIGRRLERGASPLTAAREAMAELGGAVVATSLVLLVVFLPVLGMEGSVGRLYAPIAISIGAAIVVSTLNAISFTPVAASRILHAEQKEPAWLLRWIDPPRRWLESLEQPYGRWLDRSLHLPPPRDDRPGPGAAAHRSRLKPAPQRLYPPGRQRSAAGRGGAAGWLLPPTHPGGDGRSAQHPGAGTGPAQRKLLRRPLLRRQQP